MVREISIDEWLQMDRQRDEALEQYARNRIVKKCKECGTNLYSYEKGTKDPGACQRCRGEEGDLVG